MSNSDRLLTGQEGSLSEEVCTALLNAQLVGVIYARYVLAAELVATIPRHTFIDRFMPALNAAFGARLASATAGD